MDIFPGRNSSETPQIFRKPHSYHPQKQNTPVHELKKDLTKRLYRISETLKNFKIVFTSISILLLKLLCYRRKHPLHQIQHDPTNHNIPWLFTLHTILVRIFHPSRKMPVPDLVRPKGRRDGRSR